MEHSSKKAFSINITFLGGFSGEIVNIFANGKKVFSKKLTTEPTSGIAGGVLVDSTESKGYFTVEIPRLSIKETMKIDLNKGQYVYIEFFNRQLRFNQKMAPLALD